MQPRSRLTRVVPILLSACSGGPAPAMQADVGRDAGDAATAPAMDERIVYVQGTGNPEPIGDVYTMKPDGTDVQRLTGTGDNGFPAWSRDGKQIAQELSPERYGGGRLPWRAGSK